MHYLFWYSIISGCTNFGIFDKTFEMTSDSEKKAIITPYVLERNKQSWIGIAVIVATWVYLYFRVIPTIYDGFTDFYTGFGYTVVRMSIDATVATILAGEVEFGSGKYYALCGLGGILSCGITHTAIVPLDLVKCRIQVWIYC